MLPLCSFKPVLDSVGNRDIDHMFDMDHVATFLDSNLWYLHNGLLGNLHWHLNQLLHSMVYQPFLLYHFRHRDCLLNMMRHMHINDLFHFSMVMPMLIDHPRNMDNFLLGHTNRHFNQLFHRLLDDPLLWHLHWYLDNFFLLHWNWYINELLNLTGLSKKQDCTAK